MSKSLSTKILAYVAIILGFFMAQLDTTIVNITLPRIAAYFNTDANVISWVVNGYNLVFAVFLITASRLADQFGRKKVFFIGVVVFTMSSLLCALSYNETILIIFRVIQGLAAAMIVPVTMPMAIGLAPREKRGMVIGLWGAFAALSAACGPVIGGVLTERLQWQSVFFVNVPIGVLCAVLTIIFITESFDNTATKNIDWGGTISLSIGAFALTLAFIQANTKGWFSIYIVSLFIIALLGFIIFFIIEQKVKEPMLPLGLLKIWHYTAGNITLFMLGIGMMSGVFLLAFYLTDIMGYSSLTAGLTIAALPFTGMIFSIITGPLSQKYGSRWFGVAGMTLLSLGAFLFSGITPQSGRIDIMLRLMVAGCGMGTTMSTVMAATVRALPMEKIGIGSGITNMARTLGTVLGIAIMITILGANTQSLSNAIKVQAGNMVNQEVKIDNQTKESIINSFDKLISSPQTVEHEKNTVIDSIKKSDVQIAKSSSGSDGSQSGDQYENNVKNVENLFGKIHNIIINNKSIAYSNTFKVCSAIMLIGVFFAFLCEPIKKGDSRTIRRNKFVILALTVACIALSSSIIGSINSESIKSIDGDISKNFSDPKFKQAMWEWLGKKGECGNFTRDDLVKGLRNNSFHLDVSGKNIKSLEGIESFEGTGVIGLICNNNQLTSLPKLPSSLKKIYCNDNKLTNLPQLPTLLKILNCSNNEIKVLPELPDSLTSLKCSNNKLDKLPQLSVSLKEIWCDKNQLTSIPTLPPFLRDLLCNNNKLTEIPTLPNSLENLQCYINKLDSLPELPNFLKGLGCYDNQITVLPQIPDSLQELYCAGNKLSELPKIGKSLQELYCMNNKLSSLPELPESLYEIDCSNNQITNLPAMPKNLRALNCTNNKLSTLPELPNYLKVLQCGNNYINVFEGSISDMIKKVNTQSKLISPQKKYSSKETLNVYDEKQLDKTALQEYTSNDGVNWKYSSDSQIKDFTFKSSNEAIVTINKDGMITPHGKGTCEIYAYYKDIDSQYTKVILHIDVK